MLKRQTLTFKALILQPAASPNSHNLLRGLSTNTAINRSLRKSQSQNDHDTSQSERWKVGNSRPPFGRERAVKRDDRFGNVRRRDGSFGDRKPSHRPFRQSGRVRDTSRIDPPSASRYDYQRKPGGNRVARRAAKFGERKEAKSPLSPDSGLSSFRSRTESSRLERPRTSIHYGNTPRWAEKDPKLSSVRNHEDLLEQGRQGLDPVSQRYKANGQRDNVFRRTLERASSQRESHSRDSTRYDDYESGAPRSIPYTTPASEFLYGTTVIVPALQSTRRTLYKLYMYDGANREVRDQDNKVRELALARSVAVEKVRGDWLGLMDKMSTGRPHNGYILEASPLPKLPVTALERVEGQQGAFNVALDYQSREDEVINGTNKKITYQSGFPRFPFVLLLEGILDPQNLGAILRTAFFLGVDAVAMSNRNSAPLSPVALKASAGASENMPLMSVNNPDKFIDECKNNAWNIYAAVAPSEPKRDGSIRSNYFTTTTLGSPTRDRPCILILGSEGYGLRWNLQRKADYTIGIEGQRLGQGGVDSLNVSVAAGLLCDAFLRDPAMLNRASSNSGSIVTLGAAEDRLF